MDSHPSLTPSDLDQILIVFRTLVVPTRLPIGIVLWVKLVCVVVHIAFVAHLLLLVCPHADHAVTEVSEPGQHPK